MTPGAAPSVKPKKYLWIVEGVMDEGTPQAIRVRQEVTGHTFEQVVLAAKDLWQGLVITKVMRQRLLIQVKL